MSLVPTTKAAGQTLGQIFIGGGIVGAGMAIRSRAYPWAVLIGTVGLSAGMWLHNKLYLEDPAARAEYRDAFLKQLLSVSLQGGSSGFKTMMGGTAIENILKFAQPSDLAEALNQELASHPCDRISVLIKLYQVGNMSSLVQCGAISTAFLSQKFEAEVANCSSFSAFWNQCDGTRGLGELLANKFTSSCVNIGLLRDAFMEEFHWVDEFGNLVPCAPPADNDESTTQKKKAAPTASPGGVWKSVLSYHKFVTQHLDINPSMLQGVIESCPYARDHKVRMADRHQNGTIELAQAGILSPEYVERNLTTELKSHHMGVGSLSQYQRECNLRSLLMLRIVSSNNSTIRLLFKTGIPTIAQGSWGFNSLNSQNNIIEFIEEWDATMQNFPQLVPEDLRYPMVIAWNKFMDDKRYLEREHRERMREQEEEDKRQREDEKKQRANERQIKQDARIREEKNKQRRAEEDYYDYDNRDYTADHRGGPSSSRKTAVGTAAGTVAKKKSSQGRVSAADLINDIEKAKEAAHSRWVDSLRMRDFGGRPFNKSMDCLQM